MRRDDWRFIPVGIDHLDLSSTYGFVAGDEVPVCSSLLNEALDSYGSPDDFVGHASSDSFAPLPMAGRLTRETTCGGALAATSARANRRRASVAPSPDGSTGPLMSLSFGVVSPEKQRFADIREITETAAELRRLHRLENERTGTEG